MGCCPIKKLVLQLALSRGLVARRLQRIDSEPVTRRQERSEGHQLLLEPDSEQVVLEKAWVGLLRHSTVGSLGRTRRVAAARNTLGWCRTSVGVPGT